MDCGRGDPGGAAEMIRQNNTQFSGERKRVYTGIKWDRRGEEDAGCGRRKNGSGDENESCFCLRSSFFTGSRCCVHYIPTQPNSFRGGGDILPPPDSPRTKKVEIHRGAKMSIH